MRSILFLIETIYCKMFKWNYPRNKNIFAIFFSFSKFRFNVEHFQKKMTLIADIFLNFRSPKNVSR